MNNFFAIFNLYFYSINLINSAILKILKKIFIINVGLYKNYRGKNTLKKYGIAKIKMSVFIPELCSSS